MMNIGLVGFSYIWHDFFLPYKINKAKSPFKYYYVSSVQRNRNKITENINLAKLLNDVNNELTVFKITKVYQDISKNTMLEDQKSIDWIDECKVVIIILNDTIGDKTYEHSIFF